jgi:hypothetical protein
VIPFSKTSLDAELVVIGRGQRIETDPVAALRIWISALRPAPAGPLFVKVERTDSICHGARLSGQSIAAIIQNRFAAAGFDVEGLAISGHSPRRAHISTAADAGRSAIEIQATSRHKSLSSLAKYVEQRNAHQTSTSLSLGL